MEHEGVDVVVAWGMEDKYLSAAEAGACGRACLCARVRVCARARVCMRVCVRACVRASGYVRARAGARACVRARASERVSVCGARAHVIDLLQVCECVCVFESVCV